MKRVLAREIKEHIGSTIDIQGWLHKKRLLGGLTFINVRFQLAARRSLVPKH